MTKPNKLVGRVFLFATITFSISLGSSVNAEPERPNATDHHAVIEIGSSNVRSSVFQITAAQLQAIVSSEMHDDERYNFLQHALRKSDDIVSGAFESDIEPTVAVVKEFVTTINNDYGIKPEHVFIVASSGVASRAHFSELKKRLVETVGHEIDSVDASTECNLGFNWAVPRNRRDSAVFIDVGSGNTKACYLENAGSNGQHLQSFELMPYGTKSFRNLVQQKKGKNERFFDAAERVANEDIAPILQSKRKASAGLVTKRRVYLAGGGPWVLASLTHPEQTKENWTTLSIDDLVTLQQHLKAGDECKSKSIGADFSKNTAAMDAFNKICGSETFNQEQRISGLALLAAMNRELRFGVDRDALAFANVARDGWRTGYLIEKILGEATTTPKSAPQ